MSDLIKRLRNAPNWMREEFGSWKSAMRSYDRAPFEAADEIEKLQAENARMKEVLERLARLGNEPLYGNSDGNIIARAELERLSRAGEKE